MIPTKIILHHSATKDGLTVSWNAIRRYHINECVWGDIGYHFGIELLPDPGYAPGSYEILMGRMPNKPGAHTRDQNQVSLGVCFVGSFDEVPPPAAQWEKGIQLCGWLCKAFNLLPRDIFGHRDFANKTCPGKKFDLNAFRIGVANLTGLNNG
jgi:hypothetical protein